MRLDRTLARSRTTPPAVVLQSSFANGLGIIRGLGAQGIPVIALDPSPRALGFLSRHASGMLCPDPRRDEEAFVEFMVSLGRRLPRRAVVFPTHDEYVWAVARNADRLEPWYAIPFSRWDAMSRLADKEQQLRAAWRADVDTPRTAFVASRDDLAEAAAGLEFPAIFKPVESLAFKQRFARPVLEIGSRAELEAVYERVADCGTLMLQEIVPGDDDSLWTVGSYVDARSEPLAVFTGRKLRQHPRMFGTARFAESVWVPELADAALRLLKELGYHGVTQVEFKRDPRDGAYKLMEVNARHWLWHALATNCGVNLSLVAYKDAIGEPFEAPRQIDGRKWILATKDLPDTLREARRGEISPVDWARSLPGTRVDGLWSAADPLPGIVAGYRLAQRVWTRRRRRAALEAAREDAREDVSEDVQL
jgi:predicted ATP-grasp superfamily ATP-dependent carboligase